MNVLSLFDGISCGQLALNRAGVQYSNYYASEIDQGAVRITQRAFPSTQQLGDIRGVSASNLPKIDLLIGGSPCQGFSTAGRKHQFQDARSALFFEYVRLLREVKPRYFLLENVRMRAESVAVITEHLGVEPVLIDSALVSAQSRKRLYWTTIPSVTVPVDLGISASVALGVDAVRVGQPQPYPRDYKKRGVPRVTRIEYRTDNKTNAVLTRCTSNVVETPTGYRYLTARECEILQTVPIDYTVGELDSKRQHVLGNGWTVDVIAHLFKGLA